MGCKLTNLPECIVNAFGDFLLSIINAPFKPFIETIRLLLIQPANIVVFGRLWAVIIYVISIFYGLFILGAGFNFIISGYNVERREQAKQWLQNIILMIICVQASYLMYTLIAELATRLTSGVISMIDSRFFLLTLDNALNFGLQIVLGIFYLIILFITMLVFAIIYVFSSIGIVFFPFGLFFYFIPPLRDVGRFIINNILIILFLPFFSSLILLGVAELQKSLPSIKIILMISGFALVDFLLILLAIFAALKAVTTVRRSDVARATVYLRQNIPPTIQTPIQLSEREYWKNPSFERRY